MAAEGSPVCILRAVGYLWGVTNRSDKLLPFYLGAAELQEAEARTLIGEDPLGPAPGQGVDRDAIPSRSRKLPGAW